MVKSILKSKTFWVNILVAIALGVLGVDIGVDPETEILLFALVNLGLRVVTKEAVKFF